MSAYAQAESTLHDRAGRVCAWKAHRDAIRPFVSTDAVCRAAGRSSGIFLGRASERMGALEEHWAVYKERVGVPHPAAAAATAAALAGAGFTTVASPALRPAQRAALVHPHPSEIEVKGCRVGARQLHHCAARCTLRIAPHTLQLSSSHNGASLRQNHLSSVCKFLQGLQTET